MRIKRFILDQILCIVNRVVCLLPIRQDQVTFVSLENDVLEHDMLQIYEEIQGRYQVKMVLIKFKQNNLWTNFLYMLNTVKQLWHINQSSIVIISDNNYVISRFKRQGVRVVQVWHATGAIKKFGNCLDREYKIANYDYVIANGEYWVEPYSQAFGVEPSQVKVLGMPRIDKLLNENCKENTRNAFYNKYPELKHKKLVLYAPTFRGNIYQGFKTMNLNGVKLVESLGEEYVLIYKYHPLLENAEGPKHERCINVSGEELYTLFVVSYMMISDYSSIIFDYSILEKPIIFYAPDQEQYESNVGYFIDYATVPGPICRTTDAVVQGIQNIHDNEDVNKRAIQKEIRDFRKKYCEYTDGNNTKRVVEFLEKL